MARCADCEFFLKPWTPSDRGACGAYGGEIKASDKPCNGFRVNPVGGHPSQQESGPDEPAQYSASTGPVRRALVDDAPSRQRALSGEHVFALSYTPGTCMGRPPLSRAAACLLPSAQRTVLRPRRRLRIVSCHVPGQSEIVSRAIHLFLRLRQWCPQLYQSVQLD